MATVEVDAADVLRLVMQFLREAGLSASVAAIQAESGVGMNIVDDAQALAADIHAGRWDVVLPKLASLQLPPSVLASLYEQVVREMVELKEVEAARALLHTCTPLKLLQRDDPARYLRLEQLLSRGQVDPAYLYAGSGGKQSRRADIARAISEELVTVQPSRLMVLLNQALRWQQHTGSLPPGAKFDIFRGVAPLRRDAEEVPPAQSAGQINLGVNVFASCAAFSADGLSLVIGCSDGIIEVYNPDTAKLRKDLAFQAADDFMLHEARVLCMALSRDGAMLATGDQEGKIKVWRLATGECLRRIPGVHAQGVSAIAFSSDGSQLLSGGLDNVACITGLRSSKVLKQFRGHTAYITAVCFSTDFSLVVTASADGSVRFHDATTTDCVSTITPPHTSAVAVDTIHTLAALPHAAGAYLVGSRVPCLYVLNQQGAVLRTMAAASDNTDRAFVAAAVSSQGGWVYGVSEEGTLLSFAPASGTAAAGVPTGHTKEVIGVVRHPHRNLLATYSTDGTVRLFGPGQ